MYHICPTPPLHLAAIRKFRSLRLINQTKSVENVIFASVANGAFGFLCATLIYHTHAPQTHTLIYIHSYICMYCIWRKYVWSVDIKSRKWRSLVVQQMEL